MTKLYHKQLGFPVAVNAFWDKEFGLTFSHHAKESCRNDRYGLIIPPRKVKVTKENLIEIEMENGFISKFLVREKFNARYDILIAFCPEFEGGFVKTLWLNDREDLHETLDKSRYSLA